MRSLRLAGGRVVGAECADVLGGARSRSDATCVVNATGPWVDELRRMADPAAPRSLRFAKGAHLVVRLDEPWSAALTTPLEGGRVQFANPWEGALLVGTTDEPYEGDPRALEVTDADVEQIVRESRASIEPGVVEHDRILSSFAGVRVLPQGDGETPSARRETVFERGAERHALDRGRQVHDVPAHRARRARAAARRPRPADARARARCRCPGAADPDAVVERLLRDHPSLAPRARGTSRASTAATRWSCSRRRARIPALLEPLAPGAPEVAAQVRWAREREWALTADDVLARRTTLASLGRAEAARARVEELLR